MISSLVREHHWSPDIIGDLFFDAEDHYGLVFWYDDLIQMHKDLEKK